MKINGKLMEALEKINKKEKLTNVYFAKKQALEVIIEVSIRANFDFIN